MLLKPLPTLRSRGERNGVRIGERTVTTLVLEDNGIFIGAKFGPSSPAAAAGAECMGLVTTTEGARVRAGDATLLSSQALVRCCTRLPVRCCTRLPRGGADGRCRACGRRTCGLRRL